MGQRLDALKHWVSLGGRMGRGDYNSVNLAALALIITANIIFVAPIHLGLLPDGPLTLDALLGWNAWLAGAMVAFAVVITISSTVRRLHDFGWSGWWMALCLSPLKVFTLFVCVIGVVILAFCRGKKEPNKYGEATPPNQFV